VESYFSTFPAADTLMRLLASLCFLSIHSLLAVLPAPSTTPPDYRFKVETLLEGMPQPMQLEIAPDGRLFFIEIAGKLRIYKPGERQVIDAGTLEVTTAQENGLLGMALDPEFTSNQFIYLLHSSKAFIGQTLSRFTMKGDELDLSSRIDMLSYEEQRRECCHHAGALRFGPDGNLYISSGDNTNPFEPSEGYAPIDERPDRGPWDAQKSSANTNDLRGKILRIKPTADGKYTIPAGNLFPPGTPQTRPEIYAMGMRNPWRFNFDAKSGFLYFGDVGPDAGGDKEERGPRGFDTINQVRQAGNYGWPYVRGHRAYREFDYETKQPVGVFDPQKPINNSPNNTGLRELPPVQPPLIWYPANKSEEFPQLASGGRTACAGPVFHFRPEFRETGGFPEHFDNCLLFYDWARPFIKWARLDRQGKLAGIEDFTGVLKLVAENATAPADAGAGTIVRRPADAIFGKDGCLYLLDYGTTWGANKDSKLLKISYQWGNIAPLAIAGARNAAGREPLTVELTSEGSKDHEGEAIRYEWRLRDQIVSTEANLRLTLREPGDYRVELRVTDARGASASALVPVMVGNSMPQVRFVSPEDGDFFTPGEAVKYQIGIQDVEDGDSSKSEDAFTATTLLTASWSKAADGAPEIDRGMALMKQSDCFNCHAAEQQVLGPPLVEIAKKYRGQPAAVDTAVERVIKGSTGVWGQLPMLPHPQHSADEVHMMVKWIMSLEPGGGAPALARGTSGEVTAPADEAIRFALLEASYTDQGRAPAGSLTGKAVVRLRSRRLEAEQADEITGPQTLGGGSASGKKFVGSTADGHTLRFTGLKLDGVTSLTCRVASAGSGGKVEFRSGSKTGPLLANVEVQPTGSWEKWVELNTPLQSVSGRNDIYAVFVNPGKGGLMNLDWVQFNTR
jgi:cytochrome c